MRFLDWCNDHRILIAVYPPHSTHRLQPLDVSLFSPLATYYSQALDQFIHQSQGISSITKRAFFQLFWQVFEKAFTPQNIHSGWSKTGLQPFNPSIVLGQLKQPPQPSSTNDDRPPSNSSSSSSAISASDWRKVRSLLKDVIEESDRSAVERLSKTIINITTENAILKAENQGFKKALDNEKKRRKRGKHLFEELRALDGHAATFFSPNKIQQAKDLLKQIEVDKAALKAQKESDKQQRIVDQQLQQLQKEQRRLQQRQQRELKRQQVAKKAAQRQEVLMDKKAAEQLQQHLQQSAKKVKKVSNRVDIQSTPELPHAVPLSPSPASQRVLQSGRISRPPRHLRGCELG